MKRRLIILMMALMLGLAGSCYCAPSKGKSCLSDRLYWNQTDRNADRCGGYYSGPVFPHLGEENENALTKFNADHWYVSETGPTKLESNVSIIQPHRHIFADRLWLYRDLKSKKVEKIQLSGSICLLNPNLLVYATDAQWRVDHHKIKLNHVLYRLLLRKREEWCGPISHFVHDDRHLAWRPLCGLFAWGKADYLKQKDDYLIHMKELSYTTCPPTNQAWRLHASKIQINRKTGIGVAGNAALKVKKVPIFYLPYFRFPIDDRRMTGFLFPTYGTSNDNGKDLTVPFYWDIAPNYDLLVTPRVLIKRGILLSGVFRYLTQDNRGSIDIGWLPNDSEFKRFQSTAPTRFRPSGDLTRLLSENNDRYHIEFQHSIQFNSHWHGELYWGAVSDDYYFQDFGSSPNLRATNDVLREGVVSYNSEHVQLTARAQSYQVLHPINRAEVDDIYERLPQITIKTTYPNIGDQPISFELFGEWVHFDHSDSPHHKTNLPFPIGHRVHLQPAVNWSKHWSAAHIKSQLELAMTHYDLERQFTDMPNHFDRALPIFSVDSGFYFDRQGKLFGHSVRQTLEPRLFYLFVPHSNQNDIPLFDTGSQAFTFERIYRTNRFTGIDRIGDANQITIGLTSRFLDDNTGEERFRFGLGQVLFFYDRQVTLCGEIPGCHSTESLVGQLPKRDHTSPLITEFDYFFYKNWQTHFNLAWNPNNDQVDNGYLDLHYKNKRGIQGDASYHYVRGGDEIDFNFRPDPLRKSSRNDLKRVHLGTVIPIERDFKGLAYWNYNLSHRHQQAAFYGLEYDSCCWAARVVASRSFTGLDEHDKRIFHKSVYFQIVLKGLGSLGSSPARLLSHAINGYQDRFGRV